MNRSFELFLARRYSLSFISHRFVSNKLNVKYVGIKEKFDVNEARVYFEEWIKSLWFTPKHWSNMTNHKIITIRRYYLPFWNFSLHGSIIGSVKDQKNSVPIIMNNVCFNDINVYAAQILDRYHLVNLNISFDNQQIVNLNNQEKNIEQWTVDRDTALEIGWDFNIIPKIKTLSLQQVKEDIKFKKINSFHFDIKEKEERLLYYPIYVIYFDYQSDFTFQCLINGITGEVTGDKQYSIYKIFFSSILTYNTISILLKTLIKPLIAIPFTLFSSFKTFILFSYFLVYLVVKKIASYLKYYRRAILKQTWKDYQSNSSQFTYDFSNSFQKEYRSYRKQQQQQKQKFESTTKDLYNLLSVSQTATDEEIKHAYLIKAKEFHPDKNPNDKNAEELFKKVNQAYTILSDKYQRKIYNKSVQYK